MKFKTEWLLILEKLAEYGSVSEAAEHLGYTQQALSYTLKIVEQYFNQTLFERHNRALILTPAGEQVLALAVKYRQQFHGIRDVLQKIQLTTESCDWKVLRSDNFSNFSQIGRLFGEIRAVFPQDIFAFEWVLQHQLESQLLNAPKALGLSLCPAKSKAIQSFQIFESPYVWVQHSQCRQSDDVPLILFDYHYLDRAKEILHVSEAYRYLSGLTLSQHPRRIMASNMYEIIQWVKAGCGKACVPLIDVQSALDDGQLILLEKTAVTMCGYLLVVPDLVPEAFMAWLLSENTVRQTQIR